jgi:hypothetical protein
VASDDELLAEFKRSVAGGTDAALIRAGREELRARSSTPDPIAPVASDLQEKVARVLFENDRAVFPDSVRTWESIHDADRAAYRSEADAVLAVIDPDGLRAEVDYWKRTSQEWATSMATVSAERDAAVREVAALRAGVEALIARAESEIADAKVAEQHAADADDGAWLRAEGTRRNEWTTVLHGLRALLVDTTPEADRG